MRIEPSKSASPGSHVRAVRLATLTEYFEFNANVMSDRDKGTMARGPGEMWRSMSKEERCYWLCR